MTEWFLDGSEWLLVALGGFWWRWVALWTPGWLRVVPGRLREISTAVSVQSKTYPLGIQRVFFRLQPLHSKKTPAGLLNGYFFNRNFGAVEKIPSR